MEKIATENLFLLEFLVDNVNLNPKCDCAMGEGERCVSFQFLDNAPLDVCEEDFTPPQQNEKDSIKSGKSCLFSLSPDQANGAIQQFDIYVTIFKKMPAGWLPEKVEVGESLISIANLFAELISSVGTSDGSTPAAKTLKDAFDIHNANGEEIGKIGVYIRMSCFGKLIVTQFQMNLEDKSVLFKDKEGKSLYRYKKAGKGGKGGGKGACTARIPPSGNKTQAQYQKPGRYNINTNMNPSMNANMNPNMNNTSPCPAQPCMMVQPPGNGMMGGVGCPFTPCLMDQALMNQYGGQPNGSPTNSPCQECGTVPNAPCLQMQGGAMGMGMGMNMGMGTGMGMGMGMTPCMECGNIPNASCMPQQAMAPYMPQQAMTPCMECGNIPNAPCVPPQGMFDQMQEGGCSCSNRPASNTPCVECAGLPNPPCAAPQDPEGNYQEIGASMGGNSLTIRVHKDKNKVEQIDPYASENNSEAGCCCCADQTGRKKKRQGPTSFDMRPGLQQGNQDMPFSFKMGKSGGGAGNNNVVVNPPVATAPDGTKFTEFSDPNKELFILRVGKKSEGMDKKQNLELELCTPRGKAL